MPVTPDKSAPYAPTSAIVDLIQRYRQRGLPSPVTSDVLIRAGISDSLVPRTLYALQILDLIDEKGIPTKTFEGIRLAPEAEYKQRLAEWLQSAYADVLKFVDPAGDDEIKIRDAFRSYNPVGQQSRMVTLFLGLLSAAGLVSEKRAGQAKRGPKPSSSRNSNGSQTVNKGNHPSKKEDEKPHEPHQPASHTHHRSAKDESYEKLLLEKFPPFDPSWNDDLKKAWFEGFKQFQEMSRKDRS